MVHPVLPAPAAKHTRGHRIEPASMRASSDFPPHRPCGLTLRLTDGTVPTMDGAGERRIRQDAVCVDGGRVTYGASAADMSEARAFFHPAR